MSAAARCARGCAKAGSARFDALPTVYDPFQTFDAASKERFVLQSMTSSQCRVRHLRPSGPQTD